MMPQNLASIRYLIWYSYAAFMSVMYLKMLPALGAQQVSEKGLSVDASWVLYVSVS